MIKFIFIPLSKKQITSQKELQKIQPKIKELQKKYKNDKEKQSKKMMQLYKEHKINPAAGCLPLIIQMVVFMNMYWIISNLAKRDNFQVNLSDLYGFIPHPEKVNDIFLGFMNLAEPSYGLAIVTAVFQYYQIKMMMQNNNKKNNKKQDVKKVDNNKKQKEVGVPDFATVMSKQMLIIIPLMTLFFGIKFPSGLALYWLTSTIFIIIQQWMVMHKEKRIIN